MKKSLYSLFIIGNFFFQASVYSNVEDSNEVKNSIDKDNFLNFGDAEFSKESSEKSVWIFKSGLEYLKYESSLPEYSGVHEGIEKGDKRDLWGLGISFGRDFYLTSGLSSTFSLDVSYFKSLDKENAKAAEDIDLDIANVRDGHFVYTAGGSLALNYLIDYKLVDVQPFIEFGAGLGKAEVEKDYTKKSLTQTATDVENYSAKTVENFTYSSMSLGVNFISYKGITSYIKGTAKQIVILNRESTGKLQALGSTTFTSLDNEEKDLSESKTMLSASLGLGIAF